jgi:hypothetical protein
MISTSNCIHSKVSSPRRKPGSSVVCWNRRWIPAFAGMTTGVFCALLCVIWIAPASGEPIHSRIASRILDDFKDSSAWNALASDQVSSSLRSIATSHGQGLCLAYDFNGVSGYAAMRRELPISFPPNYEFDFKVRGSGPANAFEFKLIDASGDNVWWVSKPNTMFTTDWMPVRYKKRHISPAWGPLTDKTLRKTQFVEFTVSANSGGKGEVCIEDLRFRERELPPSTLPAPRVTASSGHIPADLISRAGGVLSARQPGPSNHSHPLPDWNKDVWIYADELGHQRDESALPIADTVPSSSPLTPDRFWRSEDSSEQTITIDFGFEREFGGLTLLWLPGLQASDYRIEFSDDGSRWREVRHVIDGNGGNDYLRLSESETRFARLRMSGGPARRFGLASINIEPLEFGATANAFVESLARDLPRGLFPRGFSGQQTYWTLIGVDGGRESGLLGEDGAVEVARGGFSIVPLVSGGRPASPSAALASGWCSAQSAMIAALRGTAIGTTGLYDWAKVRIDQSLAEGYLPMPGVGWSYEHSLDVIDPCAVSADSKLQGIESGWHHTLARTPDVAPWHLAIDTFAKSDADSSQLFSSYTLTNTSDAAAEFRLMLTIQPFQVNPPVQFLTTPGGISPIHELGFDGKVVGVNGNPRVWPLQAPDAFVATPFDQDMIAERLTYNEWPSSQFVVDEAGLASGALIYRIELAAHASKTISLDIPLRGSPAAPAPGQQSVQAWVDAQREQVAAAWKEKLNRVKFTVPPQAQPIVDTLRTALAHILISRDGVQIRPGTRSYARSWIRDGAMTAEALLRMGHAEEARDFLEWFAPYQFENGKVPCCVDARGSDLVPENDSHGELIYLIAEVARFTQDKALAQSMWPHVDKATRYMDELRASERTEANRGSEKYGLLPPSISHEGYSSKPAYSHWDNFWGLTGYNSAIELATMLDRKDDVARLTASRDQFRGDILASLDASTRKFDIDYIPGAADLGDFDATSTTIALAPGGQLGHLPADLVHNTFERYWNEFVARRDGKREWKDYTPYEWRNVGAFIRLGWRERALEAIDFFFRDRRPLAWNQWAEVVGKDYRRSRFIGDMPHGWVASDFIRSALDLFAYERASDQSIVLAAGIPEAWLADDGIAITDLQTAHGPLSYQLSANATSLHLTLRAEQGRMPAGGYVLKWPLNSDPGVTRINGRKAVWVNGELQIDQVPAEVIANRHSHRYFH